MSAPFQDRQHEGQQKGRTIAPVATSIMTLLHAIYFSISGVPATSSTE
jgi:hypothetical protein